MASYTTYPSGHKYHNFVLVFADGEELSRCPGCPITLLVFTDVDSPSKDGIKRFSFTKFLPYEDAPIDHPSFYHWLIPVDDFYKSGMRALIDYNYMDGSSLVEETHLSNSVWVVASSSSRGKLNMSKEPVQHTSKKDALREANRLAVKATHEGSSVTHFLVFQLIGVAEVGKKISTKGF